MIPRERRVRGDMEGGVRGDCYAGFSCQLVAAMSLGHRHDIGHERVVAIRSDDVVGEDAGPRKLHGVTRSAGDQWCGTPGRPLDRDATEWMLQESVWVYAGGVEIEPAGGTHADS